MPMDDGRDTVEMLESQAAEIGALRSYVSSQDRMIAAISSDIATLEGVQAQERAAWQRSVEKLQLSNKKLQSPWSIGFFGGYDALHREFSVGVGICFSVIKF